MCYDLIMKPFIQLTDLTHLYLEQASYFSETVLLSTFQSTASISHLCSQIDGILVHIVIPSDFPEQNGDAMENGPLDLI